MSSVKIHGAAPSGYTRTARLALEEKGVPHVLEGVAFGSDAHRAIHPFLRIPILEHGDFVLWETSAIARYVDEAFDGPALQPADLRGRARMEQWISAHNDYFAVATIRQLLIPRLLYPRRGMQADEEKIAAVMPRIRQDLAIVEEALSQAPYFVGDAVSLADLFFVPTFTALELTPEGKRALRDCPAIERWRERMMARPSFAATVPDMTATAA